MDKLPENLEGMSVVTEQGIFGELDVEDPNVRNLKKKKKNADGTDAEQNK